MKTSVVRVPGFLSPAETDRLADALELIRRSQRCGEVERDATGAQRLGSDASWRTTYLHTNGVFADDLPGIRAKIKDAAIAVDAEHWHQLDRVDPAALAVRTAEYHEYWPVNPPIARTELMSTSYGLPPVTAQEMTRL